MAQNRATSVSPLRQEVIETKLWMDKSQEMVCETRAALFSCKALFPQEQFFSALGFLTRLLWRFKDSEDILQDSRRKRNRRDWPKSWLCIISLVEEHIVATDEGRFRYADDVQRSQALGQERRMYISVPEPQGCWVSEGVCHVEIAKGQVAISQWDWVHNRGTFRVYSTTLPVQ